MLFRSRLSLRAGEVTAINNALQSVLDNIAAERAQVATAHNNDVTVTIAGEKAACDTRATDNYDLSVKALQNDVDQANTELNGDGANLGSIKEESIASAANDLAKMDYDTASELLDAGKAKRTREIAAANARQGADQKAANDFHAVSVAGFNKKKTTATTYLNGEQVLLKVIRTALRRAGLLFDDAHTNTATCTGKVGVYEHGDFKGWKAEFGEGDHDYHDFPSAGAKNDKMSAMTVPEGCQAKIFEHAKFGGYGVTFTAGRYDLNALRARGVKNDDVSSIKVGDAIEDITHEFIQMGATAAIKHMTLMATRLARHRAGLDPTEASKIQSAETNRVNDAEAKKFRDEAVAENAKQQSEGADKYTKTEYTTTGDLSLGKDALKKSIMEMLNSNLETIATERTESEASEKRDTAAAKAFFTEQEDRKSVV